jgi:hypothetical protein
VRPYPPKKETLHYERYVAPSPLLLGRDNDRNLMQKSFFNLLDKKNIRDYFGQKNLQIKPMIVFFYIDKQIK